ncbi:S8 family serine peptidase [Streptomyces sp. STR69]|uniref:S8 family serine peptidase n=1 Tax=Streptomyces sp. STR69 TaxID=1796942 RepID=UPI0021C9BE5B|nr:S8 family serine peptidase [Streptomyces sp. STR69]
MRCPVARRLFLLPVVLAVSATLVAASPTPRPTSVSLPVIPSELTSDAPCTPASKQSAEARSSTRAALGLNRTWQLTQGSGVTVAVVDTGVAEGVSALAGRVSAPAGAGEDCVGHGSFVAGLIAARSTDAGAFAGVAPLARILAVRGTDDRGVPSVALVADGIRAAVNGGAEVIAVSAALADGREQLTSVVAYATAHDALVVAPAVPDTENDKDGAAGVYWPASAPGALSVGGTGLVLPAAAAPDLAAPADGIVGVGPRGSGSYIASGSSLASAFVAGAAALVRSRYPALSAAQTAARLTDFAYPAVPPRLDPYAAVTAVRSTVARAPGALPDRVRIAPPASGTPRAVAVLVAGVSGGLVLLTAAALLVIPRGRARRWRPADSSPAPPIP